MCIDNKAGEGAFDPVTEADRAIEAFIRERITDAYPGHGVIGEEYGEQAGSERCTWFVDPIDGTAGYVIGSPMWGTLLGLLDEDECALGLMHQPLVQETYIGSANGAYIVGKDGKQEIRTSETRKITDAVLCCTHRSMFSTAEDQLAYDRVADESKLSRMGTAS